MYKCNTSSKEIRALYATDSHKFTLSCVLSNHFTNQLAADVGRRTRQLIRSIKKVSICTMRRAKWTTKPVWPGMTVCCALKLLNLVPTPPHFSFMSRSNTEFKVLLPQHLFAWELHRPSWSLWLFMSEMWSLGQLLHLCICLSALRFLLTHKSPGS